MLPTKRRYRRTLLPRVTLCGQVCPSRSEVAVNTREAPRQVWLSPPGLGGSQPCPEPRELRPAPGPEVHAADGQCGGGPGAVSPELAPPATKGATTQSPSEGPGQGTAHPNLRKPEKINVCCFEPKFGHLLLNDTKLTFAVPVVSEFSCGIQASLGVLHILQVTPICCTF